MLYQTAFENMLMKKNNALQQTEKPTVLYQINGESVLGDF